MQLSSATEIHSPKANDLFKCCLRATLNTKILVLSQDFKGIVLLSVRISERFWSSGS